MALAATHPGIEGRTSQNQSRDPQPNHKTSSHKLILLWTPEDGKPRFKAKSWNDTSDDTTINMNSRGHSPRTSCALSAGLRPEVQVPLTLTVLF